ncbi:kinase-like domain-containing protein [Rhizophagus clarus]|uniref:Kinase-like domain-containing protein n=1 Tax=Rhizophagus clarus TaxID=94130 RepID=A0A8H3KTF7_9GLOM|nr:kinase-like domain-containing protein [Rhizophagus clarus]
MSTDSDIEDTKNYIDWLERSIANEHINYYKYSDFTNIQKIGSGAFGSIVRANWKHNRIFALKSFNNQKSTLKEVVNELKLHRNVNIHDNILRFCGITKEVIDAQQMNNYILVLEYADSGTLENYLHENFHKLGWDDKLGLAFQLSNAVLCLHERDIIHCDLHAANILVHQKNIKLADFGLSRKIAEASNSTSSVRGVVPYVDPKRFADKDYKLSKKSDIYSIGVIMWQISSGYQPFYLQDNTELAVDIQLGKREEIIPNTPVEYSNLFIKCWEYEPNERPNILEVVSILESIILDVIDNNDNKEKEKYSQSNLIRPLPNIYTHFNGSSSSTSGREIMGLNDDLVLDNIPSIVLSNSNLSLQTCQTVTTGSENNSNYSSDSLSDSINHIFIDELIRFLIKKHNQGVAFDQIKQLINQQILKLNQNTDNLVNWLLKNQDDAQYIWFLGLFYYYNIINTEESSNKAFQLFSEASKANFSLAQVYLANCYNEGYGTEKNQCLAFEWYKKSVENKSIVGQFYLGYCYEEGIGIERNKERAVYWYKKATYYDHITAKLHLANCYRLGNGIKKDEIKAFKYYKTLAKSHEVADAQYHLGNCFNDGIGTKIDKHLAIYWYIKAAKSGNIIAKDILKDSGSIIIKDILKDNEINSHKILISKRLSQFGLYYLGKLFIRIRYDKAFNFFKKAAEFGNKVALHNLGCCYRDGIGTKKNERSAFESFKKSADQGYIDGIFRLGYCYDKGIGTSIDKAKAFELYGIAAKKGNLKAQNNLGHLYEKGEGTEKDLNKAIRWYKKAADNGNRLSQYNLGICYENEIGVEKSDDKAFEYYKKSAKYRRLYTLTIFYGSEINIEKDIIKAFESYKKVAKQKYIDAQYKVAYFYDKGIGTKTDKKEAFELFKKLAKKGNKFAQIKLGTLYEKEKKFKEAIYWYNEASENEIALYNLGRCYEYGMGVDKNDKLAFEYYQKSAEQGHIDGKFRLGNCFDKGIGTQINKIKAFELYKEVAGEGNKFAQNILGYFYEKGEGTKKNVKEAIFWYRKAADNGNEIAQYNLGIFYENGIGIEINENKAFKYYNKSAEQGYLNAKYKVAECYYKGIGTDVNKEAALELYKETARKGNKSAQISLGLLYEIENNGEMAFFWYNEAANNGSEVALYNLGKCYEHGIGVKKDEVKAFGYYKKSDERGYLDAKYKVAECYNKKIGTDINKNEALKLYKETAEKGNKFAQNSLGFLYENGDGIEKNEEMAFFWYEKAANNGSEVALYNLGRCYEHGIGVIRDEAKAFKFYKKSAEYGYSNAQYKVIYYKNKGIELHGKKVGKEYEYLS